jgi:hypothetical protein
MYNTIEEFEDGFKNKDFEVGIAWESEYIPYIKTRLVLHKFIWKDKTEKSKSVSDERVIIDYNGRFMIKDRTYNGEGCVTYQAELDTYVMECVLITNGVGTITRTPKPNGFGWVTYNE